MPNKQKEKRFVRLIELSRQAYGPYKWQMICLAFFGLIGSLAEGIGINLLIPLFSFVVNKENNNEDIISLNIEKVFNFFQITYNLKYLLFFIAGLFLVKGVMKIFLDYINIKITSDYEEKTRSSLFTKTLSARWPYLLKQKLGHLESILLIDIPNSTDLLRHLSAMIVFLVTLFVYAAIAINISFYISLAGIFLGFLIFFGSRPLFSRIKKISYNFTRTNKNVAHLINENLLGIKTIKALLVGDKVIDRGNNYFAYLKKMTVKAAIIKSLAVSFIQPLALVFICIIFAFLYKSPNFNIAVLAAIVYLIQRIFIYIEQVQKTTHTITALIPFLSSVIEYESTTDSNVEIISGDKQFTFDQVMELKNLDFSYDNDKNILAGINFILKRGEMVGLIGPSGVGKTTLVDLLLRLLRPSAGQILLDGVDSSEINLSQWRQKVGYVSQDMFLINDTIKNNIKFYTDISDDDMIAVSKMANIYDYIQSLPDKFETIVGERGVLLSAGQRQRIVIARTLARKPELLILDEATSALDNESEVYIQKVIDNLKGKITVVTIAHRLSTVMNCDRLIVLEKGKIAEEGPPQDLLADKDSYFFKVYNIRE